MAKTALDIIADQAHWVQDRMVYGTTAHVAENLDSFPVVGLGLAFVQRSAESMVVKRVEEELVPLLDAHVETQLAFTRALADREDRDAVVGVFAEELLETDPLWDVLNHSETVRAEAREAILDANVASCSRAAEWAEEAGDATFGDYPEMVVELGLGADEAVREIDEMLYYVELMREYRDHIDASGYSSVLDSDRVHDWFLEQFLEGLRISEQEVLDEIRDDIAAHGG